MSDTAAPATSIPQAKFNELLVQFQTFNALLHELLRDRDQPPISEVIKDYLTSVQRIEANFGVATVQVTGLVGHLTGLITQLTAQLQHREAASRPSPDQALTDRLDRLDTRMEKILGLLGHPLNEPFSD